MTLSDQLQNIQSRIARKETRDEKQDIYYNNNAHAVSYRMQWAVISVKVSETDQEEP